MEKQLKRIRSFSKKFILGWCLLILVLVLASQNLSSLLEQGPNVIFAQEDYELGNPIGETPIENYYDLGDPVGETPIQYDYELGEPTGETPIQYDYQPGDPVGETPINTDYQPGDPSGEMPVVPSDNSPTQQYTSPSVIRSYPECAGSPGMVHTVDQMSDGTYQSKNDNHFQAGVCGDTSNQQPQAQVQQSQPEPTIQQYQPQQVTQQSAPTVVRTYSECAGAPGMVRDVEQLSNGGYRTFNEHFQAGACGDQMQITPSPTVTPTPTSFTNYRCEGATQVYYHIYSDGRYEATGQRNNNSFTCGYQSSPTPTPTATPFSQFQGTPFNNFFQSNSTPQYSALSVNCMASSSSIGVNQSVSWRAVASGGSGSFDYRWSGEQVNGQTGGTIFATYASSGNKTVQVMIRDTITGNSVSATCSTNIMAASPTPTSTPFNQFNQTPIAAPTFAPYAPIITNTQPVPCPTGTIERSRSGSQLVCEKQSPTITTVTAQNSAQCPSGTVEKSRNNNEIICERQSIITTAAVSPSPSSTTVQCPSGTTERSRSATEIICERQTATTTGTNAVIFTPNSTSATQTKEDLTVLTQGNTSIKELPKTGLPLAAVGIASMMPIGLRIRRKLKFREIEESANDIWIKRQLM